METKMTFKHLEEFGVKIGEHIMAYDENQKIKRYKIVSKEYDHYVVIEVGRIDNPTVSGKGEV